MHTLNVELGSRSYPILIDAGILGRPGVLDAQVAVLGTIFFATFAAAFFAAVFSADDCGITFDATGTPFFFSGFTNFGFAPLNTESGL